MQCSAAHGSSAWMDISRSETKRWKGEREGRREYAAFVAVPVAVHVTTVQVSYVVCMYVCM